MVPETFLRTWNKEILNVFIPFFPVICVSNGTAFWLLWSLVLTLMVLGTGRSGTWFCPCGTVVHFTCHHPQPTLPFLGGRNGDRVESFDDLLRMIVRPCANTLQGKRLTYFMSLNLDASTHHTTKRQLNQHSKKTVGRRVFSSFHMD